MDVEAFITAMTGLTGEDLVDLAARIDARAASAAGEVAWVEATVTIERLVRVRRRGQVATTAGTRAAAAVHRAAVHAGLDVEDPRVRAVARAAAEIVRGMTVGSRTQVGALLSVWTAPVAA